MIEIKQPGALETPQPRKAVLSNNLYDILKKVVQIVLPALGSLYFGLAQIWDLPAAEEVVGTLALVATFLGVIIGISTHRYDPPHIEYDGQLVTLNNPDGTQTYSLNLNADPQTLVNKDSLVFKVHPNVEIQ